MVQSEIQTSFMICNTENRVQIKMEFRSTFNYDPNTASQFFKAVSLNYDTSSCYCIFFGIICIYSLVHKIFSLLRQQKIF